MDPAPIASIDFSILSYFNLDAKDSTRFVYCLERIDPQLTRIVDLEDFAKAYCPQSSYCLSYLWSIYYSIKYSKSVNLNKVSMDDVPTESPEYHQFIPFLFLLMSLKDRELLKLLYWLVFWGYGALEILPENLVIVQMELWKDEKSQNKFEQMRKRNLAIINARKDYKDFTVDMFIVNDLKTGGAYSRPIITLRNSIRHKLLGKLLRQQTSQISLVL